MPEMHAVKSTNVEALGHEGTELHVAFKSGGTYVYEGVSPQMFALAREAKSVGGFIAQEIRGKYKARRLDDQPQPD